MTDWKKKLKYILLILSIAAFFFGLGGRISSTDARLSSSIAEARDFWQDQVEIYRKYAAVSKVIEYNQTGCMTGADSAIDSKIAGYREEYPDLDQIVQHYSASDENAAELARLLEVSEKNYEGAYQVYFDVDQAVMNGKTYGSVIMVIGAILFVIWLLWVWVLWERKHGKSVIAAPTQPQPVSTTAAPQEGLTERLEKLAKLHEQCILTDEEFQNKKKEILEKL